VNAHVHYLTIITLLGVFYLASMMT